MRFIALVLCGILIFNGFLIYIDNSNRSHGLSDINNEMVNNDSNSNLETLSNDAFEKLPQSTTRAPRNDIEPNNNLDTASQIYPKYDFVNKTYIEGNFSSGDTIDCYQFYATKGDASGSNADKMYFWLHDINTASGVFMELYAPKPYTHRLAISEVHYVVIHETNPGYFEMVAPVDGIYYIKVISNSLNPGPLDGYKLQFCYIKEPLNAGYPPGDNSFGGAQTVDTTKSITFFPNQYLDPVWDIHDFYNFTGYEDQELTITLTMVSTADYDLYLFDQKSVVPFRKSETPAFGTEEKIKITLTETKVYYVRVWAKVNGTIKPPNNWGWYSIEFSGNIPPKWNNGSTDYFVIDEDDPPIYIELVNLWNDLNKDDTIDYLIWNETLNGGDGDWEPRKSNYPIISEIIMDNLTIQIINNGTIFLPEEVLNITAKKDKFGIHEIQIGARDDAEVYAKHNITIEINPINDPPIINNTKKWTRFLPDELTVQSNKIIVNEENDVKIQVSAYDIDGDNFVFSDNTDLFDIESDTGLITFYADYTLIDTHKINITVTDDGTNPDQLSTTLLITFEIKGYIDHRPKTNILGPENNSIIKTLHPTLIWNVSDVDTKPDKITYEVYLSTDLNEILTLSKNALIHNDTNITTYSLKKTEPLVDGATYYWTVIPFDGIFTGICLDDYSRFIVDTKVLAPSVTLISPKNGSILNYTLIKFNWSIEYDGDKKVVSDLYIGASETDLKLYETDYEDTTYSYEFPSGHKYYWKVIPKAGVLPSRVTGDESLIYTFEIQKNYQPPTVRLITPVDRSILKENKVTLKWEVNYKRPVDVGYEVYLSEKLVFSITPNKIVQGQRYLELTGLSNKVYYWKIVPFVGDNPGPDSDVWWFKIDPLVVQPIVVPLKPENNVTINSSWVELKWTLNYTGPVTKVRYTIYIDNTTNDRSRMKLVNSNYKQLFFGLNVDDLLTYHWVIIPSIEIEEGFIVGEFKGRVSTFFVNYSHLPDPKPKFELTINPSTVSMPPGNTSVIEINIRNTGNVELAVDIEYTVDPADILFLNLQKRRIVIVQGVLETTTLLISAPPNAKPNTAVIIKIEVSENEMGLVEREILTVKIRDGLGDGNGEDGRDSLMIYGASAVIVIIIIILLIFFVIVPRNRRKREESKKDEEPTTSIEERVPIPSSSPYSSPTPTPASYQPADSTTTAPPIASSVASREPSSSGFVKPITPVTPVLPVKPVSPVKPVTPASPVKAVTPVSAVTPTPAVKPVNPVKPMESAEPVEPVESEEPAKPVTPTTEPTTTAKPAAKPVAPTQTPVTPVKPAGKPVKPVKPIEKGK